MTMLRHFPRGQAHDEQPSPPQSELYIELDHPELQPRTGAEFRQLLDRIRQVAGLTCGQIAIKTTIPRSQAYNLVSGKYATLPRQPEQVREFVTACKLNPLQVDIVLDTWETLRRSQLISPPPVPAKPTGRNAQAPRISHKVPPALLGISLRQDPSPHRQRPLVDLLHYILSSEERTRRALLILRPLVTAFVLVMTLLVVWAMRSPEIGDQIATGLGGLAGLSIVAITSRSRREAARRRKMAKADPFGDSL